jgi:hypothetical protein
VQGERLDIATSSLSLPLRETVSWRFAGGSDGRLDLVSLGGDVLMGENSVRQLAYGVSNSDACPKQHIQEWDAITLAAAQAYANSNQSVSCSVRSPS